MDMTIDSLSIEIEAKAKDNLSALDNLATKLNDLKTSVSGGISGLNSISNSLTKFNNSMKEIKNISGIDTKLNSLMNTFSSISYGASNITGFSKGVNSFIRGLEKLKLVDIGGLDGKINNITNALKPLTDEMIRGGSRITNYGEQMKYLSEATKKLEKTSSSNKKSASNFSSLTKSLNFGAIVGKAMIGFSTLRRGASMIAGTINNINAYIENINLFAVALGDFSEEGKTFAQLMQDILGIDAGQAMRYMGVFMQMSTAMGVAQEQAYKLSKNFTQLGYDIASFYNIKTETAFEKLQSGLSGQSRAVRELGFDITEARLKQELLNLGFNNNIKTLSQADKAILRYIALMKQSENAQSDFARTLNTPANAMRILKSQVTLLSREIGKTFIPILMSILPPAIAVVKVLGILIGKIAELVGFKMPEIQMPDSSGIKDLNDGIGDTANNANKAKKAINTLIGGFDELNIIQKPDKDAGLGVGDMGNILGDVKIPEYDMFAGLVSSQVDEIVKKTMEWLGFTKEVDEATGKISWKLKDGYTNLKMIKNVAIALIGLNLLSKLFKLSEGLGAKGLSKSFKSLSLSIGDFKDLYGGSLLKGITQGTQAWFSQLGAITKLITSIGGFIVSLVTMSKYYEKFSSGAELTNEEILKTSLIMGGLIIAAGLLAGPVGIIVVGVGALIGAFAGWCIAMQKTNLEVNLFDKEISKLTANKLEPFLEDVNTLDKTMKGLKWSGEIISDNDVANVRAQVSKISSAIINELDADKNGALKKLQPLKALMGDEVYNSIISSNQKFYDNMKIKVSDGEKQINKIMEDLHKGKIADTEWAYSEINRIQNEMQDMGIKYMSESQTEANLIYQRLVDNKIKLSAKESADIVKNSLKTMNETIQNANKQYNDISFEAQRMYDVGAINKEMYDNIIKNAGISKDSTIKDAEEQNFKITEEAKKQSSNLIKEVNWSTGEVKTKWQIFWEDTQKSFERGWNEVVNFFTKA
ncbi:MAG: hypothetical protein RR708_04350, partial [Bacilli bacterium]